MAEEPQPSGMQEGASDPRAPPSLDAPDEEAQSKKQVDAKALGEAMKSLSVSSVAEKGPAEKIRVVKVDAADVALLVTELELSKAKATELLRAHSGDPVKAVMAFVSAV